MKRFLILFTLATVYAVIISGCAQTIPVKHENPDDPFIGWYELPSRQNTIIPVFKIEDTYHSVCRGTEIPFRQTTEGLEWALEPSSMTGTKIILQDAQPFIIIRDAQAEHFMSESEWPHDTAPRPMKRIDKPSWLLNPKTSSPRSNDDFIGCFEPVWFPYFRLHIRKEGQTYQAAYLEVDETLIYKPEGKMTELTPLLETLGFSGLFGEDENRLIYNKALRRFEMLRTNTTSPIRMPLVRLTKPCESGTATVAELVPIGIPTWH